MSVEKKSLINYRTAVTKAIIASQPLGNPAVESGKTASKRLSKGTVSLSKRLSKGTVSLSKRLSKGTVSMSKRLSKGTVSLSKRFSKQI